MDTTPTFTVEGFTPSPVRPGTCNCSCGTYHPGAGITCAGDAARELTVTWISVMTGEAAAPRTEPVCLPCHDEMAAQLASQRRYYT